ncbi:19514_t:CDS:1, partial [Cetraspora pellucida]
YANDTLGKCQLNFQSPVPSTDTHRHKSARQFKLELLCLQAQGAQLIFMPAPQKCLTVLSQVFVSMPFIGR